MEGWNDLFVATAGAAAALAGLIFVGISINLQKILSFAKLPERALMPLIMLLSIIILSIIFLIPQQPLHRLGIEILIMAILVWLITLKIDYSIYKGTDAKYKKESFFNCVFDQLSIIPYLLNGIFFMYNDKHGTYFSVAAIILSFIKVIADAWVLTIEINR